MLKVTIGKHGIINTEEIEVYDFIAPDLTKNDLVVICEETKKVCKYQESSQFKKDIENFTNKINQLNSKTKLTKEEKAELQELESFLEGVSE